MENLIVDLVLAGFFQDFPAVADPDVPVQASGGIDADRYFPAGIEQEKRSCRVLFVGKQVDLGF